MGGISLFLLNRDISSSLIIAIRGHSLAPALYLLAYIAAGVLLIPSTILKIAAGSIFGLGKGLVLCVIGSTLGTILGFYLARFSGSEFVREYLIRERYQPLQNVLRKRGEFLVFILRVVPGIPFNVLNTASGLFNLRFWPYLAASFFGSLPSILVLVYFSNAITESLVFQRGILYLLLSLGALILFLVLSTILKKYSRLPVSSHDPGS